MREAMKYVVIVGVIILLVIVGGVIVQKVSQDDVRNIFDTNSWQEKDSYNAEVSLLDEESGAYVSGAELVVKDEADNIVETWTTNSGIYIVNNLKEGKYTLVQESAADGYKISENNESFEITDQDVKIVMYNQAMTEEEIAAMNTISSDINVEDTLSTSSPFSFICATICSFLGALTIIYSKKLTKRFN